uniref:Glycosyltransferase n=1 Tax=Davidia involucrata TaxID=16924 RepID=A0A5B6YXW1_DAVIN
MVDSHIILLISAGQGTVNPALEFAKHLIRRGVKVTIVTSVFAHRRMTKTAQIPEGLTIAAFSDGYDEWIKIGDDKFEHFLSEFRSRGSRAIAELITASIEEGHPITRLVYTMGQTWAAELARGLHIPSTLFWIQPATVFDIYYSYFNGYGDMIRKSTTTSDPIEIPGLPLLLTSRDLPSFLVPSNSNSYSFVLPLVKEQLEYLLDTETNPPKILVNTFDAIEPAALRAIEKFNLIPIGPLVPPPSLDRKDYVEWLNSKPESSVVYVSFGSIVVLSKQQMEEIARGLLESHWPFMWVIRETEEIGDKQEELEQQGIIVPWCSQVDVLSHPSLGCFVSHCGWNSSLESLVSGVPMVGFPQFTDQMTNAKLIEDVWKTGVRGTPNEEGIVNGDEIKRCIEMVMGGEEFTRNAKKWKASASQAVEEGGSLDMNLKAFVDEL